MHCVHYDDGVCQREGWIYEGRLCFETKISECMEDSLDDLEETKNE